MSPTVIGLIGVAVLFLFLLSGMPLLAIFALIGFAGFSYLVSLQGGLSLIAVQLSQTFLSYSLTAVPMFILMGCIAFESGISRDLFAAAYKFFGRAPGGLAIASIAACAGFAAICGSTNASAAAMGKVAIPEMRRYNYDLSLATGCVASGGSLGILIPPSVVFIIYGILVAESIGKLFVAGILPGILLATIWMVTIYILCRRNPALGPAGGPSNFKEKLATLPSLVPMLVLFVLVLGGLFIGFFTPTEAGAVGAAGAMVIALVMRRITWQGFINSVKDTTRITGMLMIILAGVMIFGCFLTITKIPYNLAYWMGGLPLPPLATMLSIMLMFLALGCFIDMLPVIMLTAPIFHPIALSLGYSGIWFGVIMVLATCMGVVTPPLGVNVYVVKGVAPDVPIGTIFRGVFPFLIGLIVCTVIVLAFPQIALVLPGLMK